MKSPKEFLRRHRKSRYFIPLFTLWILYEVATKAPFIYIGVHKTADLIKSRYTHSEQSTQQYSSTNQISRSSMENPGLFRTNDFPFASASMSTSLEDIQ